MRRGTLTLILLIVLLLMGFGGGTDIEDQAFIVSIGVDIEENGMYTVTLIIPSAGGGEAPQEEAGSLKSKGYETVQCKGHSVLDALDLLAASVPRVINYSQLLQVVVSEELANGYELKTVLKQLLTVNHINQSAVLVVSRTKAGEFLETQQPYLGIRLSANIRTSLEVFENQGIIPDVRLGEVSRLFDGGYSDVLLPYVANTGMGDTANPPEGSELDVLPGDVEYGGLHKIYYLGAAILSQDHMVGTLTGMEMQFASFLLNRMKQFTLLVDGVYYRMNPITPTRLSVEQRGDKWTLKVSGTVQANDLRDGAENAERVKAVFTDEVLSMIAKLQQIGADPIGFEGRAMRCRGTMGNWTREGWLHAYQNAEVEVNINVRIEKVH